MPSSIAKAMRLVTRKEVLECINLGMLLKKTIAKRSKSVRAMMKIVTHF